MSKTAEGVTFYYNIDDNPANSEIKQPGYDLGYRAEGPTTYTTSPDERLGVPPGNATGDDNKSENVPPASSKVIPDQMKTTLRDRAMESAGRVANRYAARRGRPGVSKWTAVNKVHEQLPDAKYGSPKVVKQVGTEWLISYETHSGDSKKVLVGGHEDRSGRVYLSVRRASLDKTADTIPELLAQCEPIILQRSKAVSLSSSSFSPAKGIWKWKAAGSQGRTYTVTIKGTRKGNIKNLSKAPVMVNCTCPYFRWWGPEHWAKVDRYQYKTRSVKPRGTATFPVMRDPDHVKPICKHLAAAMNAAKQFRFAGDQQWSLDGPLLSPYRVAFRFAAIRQRKIDPYQEPLSSYARVTVQFDLKNSKELDRILSVAAQTSGSIPFITRNHPHQISIDLPIGPEERKEVMRAIKRLPFVKNVYAETGGRIRG